MQLVPDRRPPPPDPLRRFEWLLAGSRAVVLLPVVVLVFAAVGAFAYGTDVFFGSLSSVASHPLPVGNRIGLLLLVIDFFLIGATMLIGAVGFYELFIGKMDPRLRVPRWLVMHDLNDLKARVAGMVVLVAAVSFVEFLVDAHSGLEVLELGGGVALVIAALTGFLRFGDQRPADTRAADHRVVEAAAVDRPIGESLMERVRDGMGDVEEDR